MAGTTRRTSARISNKQSKPGELSSISKVRPTRKRTINDGLYTSTVSPAVDSGSEVPSTKRRRTTRASMATATTSEYTSPPSFEFSRDGTVDTPTTSVGDVEMNDVGTELENLPKSRNGKKTVIPPSDGKDDEPYLSNEDEQAEKYKPRRNKGKGKAVANSYSESEDESQFELEEGSRGVSIQIPDSQDESEFEIEEGSDSSVLTELSDEDTIAAPPTASSSATANPPQPVSARRRRSRWMHLTRAERDRRNLYIVHPSLETAWDDLDKRPRIDVKEDEQPAGLSLSLLPFQKEGLYWLRHQEQGDFGGGILADEMGMGKTIQTLSLIMSDPNAKPNLVVAPTVAIMQWKAEIEKYTGSALSVYIFHGAGKTAHHKELAKYNVVLTTYNLLESVFRKQESGFKRKAGLVKEASVLHKIDYHRVILDEAHNIKDRSCNTAKAVFALRTKHKLCLSGTPLQNRIGELFSLLRFLELDPFAYYFCRKCPCKQLHWKFSNYRSCDSCGHPPMSHLCLFNYDCLKPIQNNGNEGDGKVAFERIHKLMSHIMLRRTKKEREEDLGLPPKVVRIRRDKFSEEELDLYDSIYNEGKRKFDTYVAQGVVLNNYANIFTLITRMRQMADHPDLVLRKHLEEGQNTLVCFICDDEAEDAIRSKCHHTFCRDCVHRYIAGFDGEKDPECPKCHITLNIDLTQPALEVDNLAVKKNSIVSRIDMSKWRSSTKIEALCEELYKLRSPYQTTKSIVFSQFTSMLQLIEWRLRRAGFKTVMLEGSMSPSQRDATIQHFMKNVDVEVFLVSLKAGGVALNLIEANQVFLMEPWWNPSVEWQAADRIHRIGQTRVCRVTRMIIEDSIESRIIDLQEKKTRMIEATVNADQKAMDRLTPADMQFLFSN